VAELAAGTLLNQRYRIGRAIGKGGMGVVYEAVDTRLQNTVAVKQTTMDGPGANRAFEREARLLAALRHPALPVVIDHFVDPDGQFLVMQYIEGEDLLHLVRRQSAPLTRTDLLACANALLAALVYLHRHDPPIVHRDLKPANIKRTPAGEYVLLDFGLAKGRGDSEITHRADERSVYGFTPTYAPPEQIQGLPTDPRSDVFALAATLYHLANGVAPPPAMERLARVHDGLPDPLTAQLLAVPGIDARMQSALARGLALDARDRFQSAAEMQSALCADAQPVGPTPAPEPASTDRRVDAALPSQAEIGRQIDLIVQVRFADSPLLGLEDWPTKRRPDRIEQGSEPLSVTYPTDPVTGAQMPARVRIKIVAPDFTVGGQAEQLVDVPPREYSKRMAFLLTPNAVGICRVNVEVYSIDAVFLGMIPVEAEAVASQVAHPVLRVHNIVLHVFTHAAEQGAAAAAVSDPITATLGPSVVAEARRVAREAAPPAEMDATLMAAPMPMRPLPAARASAPPPAAEVGSREVLSQRSASGSNVQKWMLAAVAAIVLVVALLLRAC
jgi:serine/threonine protein kinase